MSGAPPLRRSAGSPVPRPRVAYLVKRFPRLSETFILGELLEVRRLGVDVEIYALADPGERVSQPAALALLSEVRYLHVAGRRARSWLRLLAGAVAQALASPRGALAVVWSVLSLHQSRAGARHAVEGLWLARDLRRRRVAHLHAHFAHGPAAVAHLARLAGAPPFSFTAHAKDLYTTPPRKLRLRTAAARFVVTCTEANATHLRAHVGMASTPLHVIHHGIDIRRFSPGHSPAVAGRLVSVGRLVPKKGHADVLEAVARLRGRGREIEWHVYGGGPLRDALLARAEHLGIAAAVHLHGARVQEEVLDALRTATAFILAPVVLPNGDRDGIPNVLVEAMACAVPVVATRVSGIPELVTDGVDGLLVDAHDPDGLAAALGQVLDDPGLAASLGAAARATVESRFDSRGAAARLAELFAEAVGPAPADRVTEQAA